MGKPTKQLINSMIEEFEQRKQIIQGCIYALQSEWRKLDKEERGLVSKEQVQNNNSVPYKEGNSDTDLDNCTHVAPKGQFKAGKDVGMHTDIEHQINKDYALDGGKVRE